MRYTWPYAQRVQRAGGSAWTSSCTKPAPSVSQIGQVTIHQPSCTPKTRCGGTHTTGAALVVFEVVEAFVDCESFGMRGSLAGWSGICARVARVFYVFCIFKFFRVLCFFSRETVRFEICRYWPLVYK